MELTIGDLERKRQEFLIQEQLTLESAFRSTDVNSIMKAQSYVKDLQKREVTESKSLLLDPNPSTGGGYRERQTPLSFGLLRGMSRTHIIKAIIGTRKEQVKAFCTPQKDKYSTGFVIQKKSKNRLSKKEQKLTKQEEGTIEDIIEFLLNCGNTENYWHADTFDGFISKLVNDSLTYDQATGEIVRNRKGEVIEFFATDASTYRLADSYDDDVRGNERRREVELKGYTPSYVQLFQNNVIAEFYPWELIWGVRNPQTDIYTNGYGRSELEDMIQTITSLLNSDSYNSTFFTNGSAPKGILKYSGNINQQSVEEFRRQWLSQVSSVQNAHKVPIINADKMEFISTHIPNKDMEFSKYQEFLIKISCALYKIDPSEIGFPMAGSSDSKPMFEGNNEARLKYSKDKGLKPLLIELEQWINKYIVRQLNKDYEFKFVGIEQERDENLDLDQDIKRLGNFMTVNEIRRRWNLEDIEGGDTILNPTFLQAKMQASQGNPDSNNEMDNMYGGGEDTNGGGDNPFTSNSNDDENNPFIKSLQLELPRLLG